MELYTILGELNFVQSLPEYLFEKRVTELETSVGSAFIGKGRNPAYRIKDKVEQLYQVKRGMIYDEEALYELSSIVYYGNDIYWKN